MEYDGGASQFAGGGFVPEDQPESTPSRKGYNLQQTVETVRAVTLRQLIMAMESSDGNLVIDNQAIGTICIVAKLVSYNQNGSPRNLKLNDGSGTLEAQQYVTNEFEQAQQDNYPLKQYYKLHCDVRHFSKSNACVNVIHIKQIQDYNEVIHHVLNCILQHAYHSQAVKQLQFGGGTTGQGQIPNAGNALNQNQGASMNTFNNGMNAGNVQSGRGNTDVQLNTELKNIIIQPPPDAARGWHISQVFAKLGRKYPEPLVRKQIDFMIDEGHLFNGSDNNHFFSM